MPEHRPLRGCDTCGGVDTDPRHVRAVPAGFPGAVPGDALIDRMIAAGLPSAGVRDQLEPTTVVRHMDCCAAGGCEVCASTLAAAGEARGPELLAYITGGP